MKRFTALLVAAVMTLGLLGLTACGEEGREPSGDAGRELARQFGLPYSGMEDEPWIEFTIFIRNPNTPPSRDNPIIDIIEQITNVRINYEFLVGDLEQRMGVMMASGDWPDAAFFGGDGFPMLDTGMALPLEDLITEYAPNLRAHFDPWWDLMRHTDGHIYVAEIYGTPVGDWREMENWQSGFWLQKSVVDHFGRAPADLDEYFQFIMEYMELNPTIDGVPTIGFEVLTEGWRRFCIDNPPMFLDGHGNWGGAIWNEETGLAEDRWMTESARRYYYKLNQMFHAGVISAESLTRTFDQYIATIASGAVLGMFDQMWNFNEAQNVLRMEGRHERTYLPFALTWPGVEPDYMDMRTFTGNNGLIVNRNISDPVRFVRFMDFIIQEEVQRFLQWGIEGEHWYFNEEGRMVRPEEQRVLQMDTRWRIDNLGEMLRNYMPKMEGTFSDGNATDPGNQPEEYFAALVDFDRELFARLGIYTQADFMDAPSERPVFYPFWSMAWEDGSPAQLADQRVMDVNQRFLSRLVLAPEGTFDELWEEYIEAMMGTGQEDLLEEINRQIQARLAAAGQ